ncbi:ornithine decarboxylase, partial [Paraburkholderia sp. SIMBA_027]
IRVYATQSTHKTLTSLRQGSMIHVFDQDFASSNSESFREAYMTHTSTSPNYQILASLDIGRRQVELEGYGLVQKQSDLAVSVAQAVARHPLLRKYFRVLSSRDLI